MLQDDAYFIKEVLNGNKQAFAFIINRYKNKLFAIILRMVKNPEDAKDLVQECFIKIYEQLGKYVGNGSFSSWLYRVSINHCMDEFRKKKFQLVELSGEKLEDRALTPEIVYLQKEKYKQLEELLSILPSEDRMVILLKYTQDLSYEEISDLLGLSVSSIRNKIHRGKKKMREQLVKEKGGYFHEVFKR
jgi:RNA polymerase sigma-70 factor (ECF subfamily)